MALLKAENLTLGYDGKAITDNLNFTVEDGDYLFILGENGSGKTTLMKTLLGLQSQMDGSITFEEGLKKNEIGYLPQQTVVQRDFPASVWEIVISGCQGRKGIWSFYSKADKELAKENIRKMQIEDLTDSCYRELSGGQQQRVLLARALCATKKVLLLDEPVSGLDPMVTAEMYELISDLNKEGITIIMISHDVEAAAKYATNVLHIGDKTFFGTLEEYKNSEMGRYFLDGEVSA